MSRAAAAVAAVAIAAGLLAARPAGASFNCTMIDVDVDDKSTFVVARPVAREVTVDHGRRFHRGTYRVLRVVQGRVAGREIVVEGDCRVPRLFADGFDDPCGDDAEELLLGFGPGGVAVARDRLLVLAGPTPSARDGKPVFHHNRIDPDEVCERPGETGMPIGKQIKLFKRAVIAARKRRMMSPP